MDQRHLAYEALDNGFLSCSEPETLQKICDALGPADMERVFRKWLSRIPLPLRPEDRRAGYDGDLSILANGSQPDPDFRPTVTGP